MIAERRQFDRTGARDPAPGAPGNPAGSGGGGQPPGGHPSPGGPYPGDPLAGPPPADDLLADAPLGLVETLPDQPTAADEAALDLAGADAGPRSRLGRWWLHSVRGWPEALPLDRPLLDACFRDAAHPGVEADLKARFRASGGRLGRFPWAIAVLELAVDLPLLILPFVAPLPWFLAWLAVVIVFEWFVGRLAFRQWFHPRLRALLRRRGVDCCLRCGHLIEGRDAAATCPECGQEHEQFPLRWAGDLAPP